MKYKYVICLEPLTPKVAKSFEDAINYIKKCYNSITFEEDYPYNDIIYDINKNGKYVFDFWDTLYTFEKYIDEFVEVVK